jgi:hypothetical protein
LVDIRWERIVPLRAKNLGGGVPPGVLDERLRGHGDLLGGGSGWKLDGVFKVDEVTAPREKGSIGMGFVWTATPDPIWDDVVDGNILVHESESNGDMLDGRTETYAMRNTVVMKQNDTLQELSRDDR